MLGVGPKADFPAAAAAFKKSMAWASDEQKLYYCTGAAWVKVAPGLVADADILNMVAAPSVIGNATHVHPAAETTILTVTVPQAGGILTYRGTFYAICSGGGPSTMRWRFRDAADALVTMYGNYQYGSASTPGPFGRGAIATSSLDILAGAQDAQGHFVVSLKPAAAGSYRITIEDVGDLSDGSTGGAVTAVWHC